MTRPSVTLRQGTFLGTELQGSLPQVLEQFLGVPYGLSTAGERRFRPPLRVSPSRDTFDASRYGQRCPSGLPDDTPMGEDCLNANIFRPKDWDRSKKLPVLVHFHGGAFNYGSAQTRNIPSLVAWSAEPMLGISFNYRIGAFGFLPIEGVLNLGLQDQLLMLEWVQENVAEFGGDPDSVTVMGVSAGAHSIGHHLMNPNSGKTPLFHRAIIESGAPTARAVYPYNHRLHQQQLSTFLKHAGCSSVRASQLLTTLRSLSLSTIKAASEETFNDYNTSIRWPFQPVIDPSPNSLIPIPPIQAWNSGAFHKIPLLTGFNTNEGAMFVPTGLSKPQDFTKFFSTLLPNLSPSDLSELNNVYPDPITNPSSKYKETRPGLGAQFKRLEQAYAHFAYIAPVRQTAQFASSISSEAPPVYLYHFAVSSSINGGANHGDHADFATNNIASTQTLASISGAMHTYWTSFICTGNPNTVPSKLSPDRPEWPSYDVSAGKKMLFGEGNDELAGGGQKGTVVKVEDDVWAAEECRYWWKRTELFEK